MSNWRDQVKGVQSSGSTDWRTQVKKQAAGEKGTAVPSVASSANNASITELRDRYEQMTGRKVTAAKKHSGGIEEGSEYQRGSVSELRENFGRFEQEQPEAAAILKRLAEERAARSAQLIGETEGKDPGFWGTTGLGLKAIGENSAGRFLSAFEYPFESAAAAARKRIEAEEQQKRLETKIKQAAADGDTDAYLDLVKQIPAPGTAEATPMDYLMKMMGVTESDSSLSPAHQMTDAGRRDAEAYREASGKLYSKASAGILPEEVGQLLGDAALATGQMAVDQGAAALLQVGYLPYLAVTGGASKAQEALDEGYDPGIAGLAGAASGLTSAAIESFGGIAGKWGGKAAGKVANTATGKKVLGAVPAEVGEWIIKAAGSRLGKVAEAMASEGAEEFSEYYVQNFFENLILDKDTPYDVREALYNALIGVFSGGLHAGAVTGADALAETVYQVNENRQLAAAVREEDGGAGLIRSAKESDIPELMELANEYEAQLRRGKALSARQLAELYTAEKKLDVLPDIGSGRTAGTYSAAEDTSGVMSEDKTAPAAEETVRTNVPAAEAISDVGEKFAAEEAKAALTPRGVELSEEAKAFAGSLGEHGQTAFMAAEEISGEDGVQRAAWQTYYNAGKWGQTMEWADGINPAAKALLVGDVTAEQAFRAGQLDAAEELRTAVGRKAQAAQRAAALKPGFVAGDGAQYTSPAVRKVLSDLSGAIGTQIELTDLGIGKARGMYDPKTGGIQLNSRLGLQGALINVAKHEVTHRVQDLAPEAYQEFKDFAVSTIYAKDSRTFEDLVQEQIDAYAEMGVKISRSEAEDEVVANAAEAFLRDEESIRKLCEKDRSLGQKILDAIRDIVRKIKKVLKGAELEQEAAQILSEDLEVLEKAEELWLRALAETKSANEKASSQESEKAVRYQLVGYSDHQRENWTFSKNIIIYEDDVQFRDFIRAALAKENLGKKLYFGMIPEELAARIRQETGLNVEDFNFTLRADEVRKILLQSHGNDTKEAKRGQRAVTEEDILMIPEIIQNPDRVSLSEELYGGKPVIHFVKTVNGRTTVVAYVSKKHFDLTVQTMYAGRKKESLATAGNAPLDTAPTQTPEAHIGTAFNDSIRESGESVKGAEEISDPVTAAVEEGRMGVLPGAEMEGGNLRYNLQTTTEKDMRRYRQMLEGTGMSEAEMADLFGFFSEIRGIIEAHKDILDFEVDLEKEKFRPVKPNSDPLYKVSVDFSTLCRKRLLTQTITERLQAQLKRPLSKEEQLEIRNRLVSLRKELEQIDVACGLCYVESRRLLSAKQIGAFFADPEKELRRFFGSKDKDIRRKVNEEAKRMIEEKGASSLRELARMSKDAADEVRAWKRAALASYRSDDSDVQAELEYAIDLAKNHREVFLSAQSLHDLMDEHPMVYDAFTTYVRNATKSKAQETRVPWRPGDSQKISDALIRRMNAENGLRMQSWSDYEVVNTLDYMTAMMELSARGAKVQTYTKVPDFVRLMGRTGAMINLSLIAKGDGVDADGNLLFDGREGMGIEDAEKLRLEYPGTAGTIIVGISDEHILAALKDDRIDYVIPYHTSGMSKEMRARAGILHWTDYESSQSEKGKGKAPSFSEWAKPRKGDDLSDGAAFMKTASERYLALCHERGLTPKFSQFLEANGDGSYSLRADAENYWKLLIDRKMVDNVTGGYIEQQAVKPVFDEQAVKDILGRELVSEAAKQNAKAADIVVDEFLRGEIEVSDETIEKVRQMEDSHLRYGIEEAMKDETKKTAPPEESGVRYQLATDKYKGKSLSEDSSVYDYDFLVSLPDMQVTVLPETASKLRGEDGRISAGEVVKEGMKNARTVGMERDGKVYVRNSYTGRELMITVSSIRHSVDGSANRLLTNSRLGTVIGDVVKNAVPVNGLYNKAEGVAGTYAMAAYAADSQGREFVGIVTVEQWTGDVAGVDVYDVTHSLSGRQKKKGIRSDTKSQGFYPTTNTSVISIADFLEIVNGTHQSVLSDDVLEHLGEERNPAGYYSDRVKFQLTPEAKERGRLIRENERLKKANAHLREGFKLTKGVEVSEADVEALAKKILKRYSSDADAGILTEALRKVYRYIGNDVEPNWETVNEVLSAAAGKVLEDSREFDRSLWEETAELRARIRETPVYVDEAMRSEFALADGYQAFKRSHSRMFKIVNDPNAMSVDQLYTELAKDYPFMLDGEAVSAYDQLQEIADFIEASKPRWQNPFGENLEEMTAELVGEMYDAYFDLPQVKTFADKKQAEIDRMRMKHRAAMQELKEAEKQKREELLEGVRERYENRITDIRDSAKAREARLKYEKWWGVQAEKIAAREAREKARDRRYITEHRRKIERKVKALSQALLSPTDMKHVPEGLRNAVKNLVGALDMTGARGEDTNVSKAWAELQAAVVAARADTNSCVTLDPDLEMRIGEIVQSGMSLNEMSRGQAEDLYRVLAALEKACREVRIELKNGRTIAATEVARGIIDDTAGMKRYPAGTVAGRAVRTFFDYDLADPVRFAERFGSHMQDLMQMLRDGHDEQTRRWNEALDYSEEMFRKAQVWKWQEAKATEFELESGEKISLNPARVMELYLLSRREQALSHIYAGGITTKEYTQGGKIVPSERVQVTVSDVAMIIQSLTDEQKQVADRMGHFLSHQASDWGNEVSMELYGYRKFTEKNYWPISSDRNYIVSQMDGNVKDGTLAGLGMTKQTVKNAGNPIMIGDAFETYAKHLTQMAAYSAFVPRLEQAKLVINWKTSHDGNLRSAKEALFRVGGVEAVGDERHEGYLQKFIVDLNGRGRVERAPTERFIGASKAAAIAGNVRVVVQQPTAYLRAAAEIDPKYLVQGLRGKRDAEEMKTYAPIARWKDWGFFEPGSGKQLSSLMIGEHGTMKAMSDIAMKPAGMMDNLTWGTLWNAVKAEVEATTDLEPGSEEYLQECGQRFSDVVDRTQVVDSVFHRTQAMRSGSVLVKMSTAFMAEPMKSLNMITGEIHKVMQANGRDAKAAAAKGLCRNVTAFMTSAILNAVVVAFVDAARDDDDDETYWQKYRQALFGEYEAEMSFRDRAKAFLSADIVENLNPMSMIPYVKDAVSLYQGYDIQRTDVQSFAELSEDLLKWGKLLNGESKYTAAYLTKETASSLSKVFGLPVSNIIRDVMSLVNLGLTIADGQGANTTRLRYMLAKGSLDMAHSSNKNTFAGFMLEARMAGDTELATRIFNDMIEAGWKNDELESAMTTRAKKLLESYADVLDAYNAAEARADAAGMEDAADELLAEGFTSAEIVKAAKSRANDSAKAEEDEPAGEEIGEDFWAEYGTGGAEFDVSFLTTALVNGNRTSAKAAEVQLRAGGKTQKEIDSAVASALKKRIVQGMGYEKISDLPEGTYLDMDTEEYRVLHDVYGKTQFSFADAAAAYIGETDITYSRVVNDMIGQKYSTSAGEKVYTKDLIREKVTEKILDWYKKGRYDGSASREELTRWKNALDNLGISGEELEEKYRKYEKGKK